MAVVQTTDPDYKSPPEFEPYQETIVDDRMDVASGDSFDGKNITKKTQPEPMPIREPQPSIRDELSALKTLVETLQNDLVALRDSNK